MQPCTDSSLTDEDLRLKYLEGQQMKAIAQVKMRLMRGRAKVKQHYYIQHSQ